MNAAETITCKSRGFEADDTTSAEVQPSSPQNEKFYLPHRFNPQVAELYGIAAALIFQYIWYRSVKMADGKWVRLSLEDIYKQYPYLGKKQVWLALQKLVHSRRKTPALVCRKPADEGYAFRYAPISRDAGNKFISFDTRIAAAHGIVAAIIHQNIAYWVRTNWREKASQLYESLDSAKFDYDELQLQRFAYYHTRKAAAHYVTVKKWAKFHRYVSFRTVKRGFSRLLAAGLLKKLNTRKRVPLWTVGQKLLQSYEHEMLMACDLENDRAVRKKCRPKGKSAGQNANVRAKIDEVFPPSDSDSAGSRPLEEADIKEAELELRSEKFIDTPHDVFRPAFANAHTGGGTPSNDCDAPSVLEQAAHVNGDDYTYEDDDVAERLRLNEEDRLRMISENDDEEERLRVVLPPPQFENSQRALSDPDIFKLIRLLNCPGLPEMKKKIMTDAYGYAVKRKCVRVYAPDDPRYDLETLEDMTPLERDRYLEQAKKKKAIGQIYVQTNGSGVMQSSSY